MSRVPSQSWAFLLAAWCGSILAAQECRLAALTPAQPAPKVEEGERALESQTFQTTALALSPANTPHFFDTAYRIRRIESDGRITTVAGNATRADTVTPGPALAAGLPAVSQIAFPPGGVLHFVAAGRVLRIVNGNLEAAAGSGRPGFNGEEGLAAEVNLGTIVQIAFDNSGLLLVLDGYNRLRRVDPDGVLRTIAGSTRAAASAGLSGDDGPATAAALSSPRQVVPLPDGSLWIKDLSGRHLRLLTPDGVIRTINQNFDASVNILLLADGAPAAATANRVYPLRANGNLETGANPFPPFTGTPLAIGGDGALFFLGSARPEQRNPLVRLAQGGQTVVAGAPVAATVDGQAPPFGVWYARTGSLIYAASVANRAGVLEARPGQPPRFLVGGGDDTGEPDGKAASSLAIYGIAAFSVDGEGRIIVIDVNRRRILVAATDGKISVLKTQDGQPVIYAPLGSFSTLQRIAADNAGNLYWYSAGGTPSGGVFTAEITTWRRATSSTATFAVSGLSALTRTEDGDAVAIAGNATNFRSAYRLGLLGPGEPLAPFRMLPLTSIAHWKERPYFTAAARLFRGETGRLEYFNFALLPSGSTFNPDFVLASPDHVLVHLAADGGFYRIENIDACAWQPQPAIAPGGIVNAASFEFPDTISPRQLITVFGTGFGPLEGQGLILDGVLRATAQPAPYPALVLGNFSGAIPLATLSGTSLPVVYSNDRQVTVQGVSGVPASGEYLLYFTWQGLQLIHPAPVKVRAATPGLFTVGGGRDGDAVALNQDGARHSSASPAAPGAEVRMYGTGFGALTNNLATGEFFSVSTPVPLVNPVTAVIGGELAEVLFAGGAPGSIGGVTQITVRVPEGLAAGPQPVTVEMGGQPAAAAQRVTLYVK